MTKRRFKEHFTTDSAGVVVLSESREPRRLDAEAFTQSQLVSISHEIADSYQRRFKNLNDVAHLSFLSDPVFLRLLVSAVNSGQPLTRAEIDRTFPGMAWDE